ncbi:hypothetical protein UP09_04845 [Bradyrhizobium sp. LTSP885]|nr:hypothetical protein UP09_04845 [Bradyrhizobium sp. LTSP885]
MIASAVDAILPADTPANTRKNYIPLLAPNDLNDMPKLMEALVADLESHAGRMNRFRVELFNRGGGDHVLKGILAGQIQVDHDGIADPGNLQSLTNRVQPFLSSKSFFDGMDAARYRVCAIWIDDRATGQAEIVGTGFLIAADLVMTARHVPASHGLVNEVAAIGPGGGVVTHDQILAGSAARLAFVFDYWSAAGPLDIHAPPLGVEVVWAAPNWLEWSSPQHPNDGVQQIFGPPPVSDCLDCAVIRLAKRVGSASAGSGGGRLRGWQKLNGTARPPVPRSALAILQHPGGGAQMFDKGDFVSHDAGITRLFYSTNAAAGSSGSPCFDANPDVVAFHNAGFPANGQNIRSNQGIFIAPVVAAIGASRPALLAESQLPFKTDGGLWSLTDDPHAPEPILGRTDFKEAVFTLFNPRAAKRVVVVGEDSAGAAIGKNGKSFSTRILRAIARRRPATVVEFDAEKICNMEPEEFLRELGRRVGLTTMDGIPDKPTDERQRNRWYANQLPKWFGDLLTERASKAGLAVSEPSTDQAGPALGPLVVLHELIWIAIDDIHKFPPKAGLTELIAGMIGVTDTQGVMGPGLRALRWLLVGHVPDFVRDKSIEYELDTISQQTIGIDAWTTCVGSAFVSSGADDVRCAEMEVKAQKMFKFAEKKGWGDLRDPLLRLKAMASGAVDAIEILRES